MPPADFHASVLVETSELLPEGLSGRHFLLPLFLALYSVLKVGTRFNARFDSLLGGLLYLLGDHLYQIVGGRVRVGE